MRLTLPAPVRSLCERLAERGFEAYPVGGCVRDSLLGRTPGDWDITGSALPEETLSVFSDCRCIETGLQHGTVTVLWEGAPYEITTFRSDGDYADHRRPQTVRFVRSLREDLRRRDFTVNAMALAPDGSVIDLFGGCADLSAGCIRCVGDPETRFTEDALRILRALRFAARLGFTIEAETAAAMHTKAPLLGCLSAERIKKELWGILAAPAPAALLRDFAPVLRAALPFESVLSPHMDSAAAVPELRLCLLFKDPAAVCNFLKCSREEQRRCLAFRAALSAPPSDRCSLLSLLRLLGEDDLRRMFAYWQPGDAVPEALLNELLREGVCLDERSLALGSSQLMALGYQGRALGEIRRRLLELVWRGEVPNRESALLAKAFSLRTEHFCCENVPNRD